MSETPRPDPWEKVQRCGECSDGTVVDHPDAPYYIADSVDAARAADADRHRQELEHWRSGVATATATVTQQAETIRQLRQKIEADRKFYDVEPWVALREAQAQIATLTQERDAAIAENIRLTNAEIEALSARCATLAAALEELYATVKGECPLLFNEDSGGSAQLDAQVSAALAAAPQGGSTK